MVLSPVVSSVCVYVFMSFRVDSDSSSFSSSQSLRLSDLLVLSSQVSSTHIVPAGPNDSSVTPITPGRTSVLSDVVLRTVFSRTKVSQISLSKRVLHKTMFNLNLFLLSTYDFSPNQDMVRHMVRKCVNLYETGSTCNEHNTIYTDFDG